MLFGPHRPSLAISCVSWLFSKVRALSANCAPPSLGQDSSYPIFDKERQIHAYVY